MVPRSYGKILIVHRYMNIGIGTEAALFTEKEYINGIFFAVQCGITPINKRKYVKHKILASRFLITQW